VVAAENDDLGDDFLLSRISHTLTANGSWTIWTTTFDTDDEMSFDLSLACAGAPEPDLSVDVPEVSPQTISSAELLSISTTVHNVGGASATMTTLRYLVSTDSVITPADDLLASEEVGNLDAGASSAFSVDAVGPTTPGTYWVGVCVDSIADETVTENNCSDGVEITVNENSNACVDVAISCGEMLSGDITSSDCDDSPRGAGHFARSFSFSASEDDTVTIDAAWTGDGYLYLEDPSGAAVAENNNSGSVLGSQIVRTLESGGTWKIWATSADAGESLSFDLALACESGVQPDLVVAETIVTPLAVEFGEPISVSTLVRNQGDGPSAATNIRFLVSSDSELDADDTVIKTNPVSILESGEESSESMSFPALFTEETIWVGVCVEEIAGELDTTNNCSAAVEISITIGESIAFNAGLNDGWFNPLTNGQGFFINVFPDVKQIFLSWFTYEVERPDESIPSNLGEAGHRWLTAQGNFDGNQAVLDIWIAEGGIFNTSPPVPVQHMDGQITLDFPSCSAGIVTYEITSLGLQGEVPVQRVGPDNISLCESLMESMTQSDKGDSGPEARLPAPAPAAEGDFQINSGLNDAWFYPVTAGQGFFINVFPDTQTMFLSWFTYDTERPDESVTAQLGDPGHRWLTAQGPYSGSQAVLDVYIAEGGVFDDSPPVPVLHRDGTIVVDFSDCNSGLVTFDIPSIGQQGEVPIERITLDNVPLCEQLSAGTEIESAD